MSEQISVRVAAWLDDNPRASFESWKAESHMKASKLSSMDKEELRQFRLTEKYGKIWREKVQKGENIIIMGCIP